MPDDDAVEPVYLDGGRTVLMGDAARQWRSAREVPVKIGDRVVGTAVVRNGEADITIDNPELMKKLFHANLDAVSVSFDGLGPKAMELLNPDELENP